MLRFTSAALLMVVPVSAWTQQRDTTSLPLVVVTATRSSAQVAASVATTHMLEGAALRDAGVRDLADALRFVPGIVLARAAVRVRSHRSLCAVARATTCAC
jgi:outer membrane cobalamin receptor